MRRDANLNPMRLPFRLSAFYFAHFFQGGGFVAYFPLYLAWRGFGALEIAWILALPQIARTFAPAAWGWIADRGGARRGVVVFSCAAAAGGFLALPFVESFAGVAVVIGAASLLSAGALPLVEAITLGALAGQPGRYGPIRLWGSVGFIGATLGGGAWLDCWPAQTLPHILVALALLSLAIGLALPASAPRAHAPREAPRLSRGVVPLLAAGFCMAAAHGTLYTFFTLHLERAGHSGVVIGALWTLGVLAEIFVFLYLPALFRRFTLSALLLASLACAVIRFLAIGWL